MVDLEDRAVRAIAEGNHGRVLGRDGRADHGADARRSGHRERRADRAERIVEYLPAIGVRKRPEQFSDLVGALAQASRALVFRETSAFLKRGGSCFISANAGR